jgi:hypothetical protein
MTISFGFTVAGDQSGIEIARKVVLQLEEMGHEVLTRHLVSENAWEADRLISLNMATNRGRPPSKVLINSCDGAAYKY